MNRTAAFPALWTERATERPTTTYLRGTATSSARNDQPTAKHEARSTPNGAEHKPGGCRPRRPPACLPLPAPPRALLAFDGDDVVATVPSERGC